MDNIIGWILLVGIVTVSIYMVYDLIRTIVKRRVKNLKNGGDDDGN